MISRAMSAAGVPAFFLFSFLLSTGHSPVRAQTPVEPIFHVVEELIYNVSYVSVNIGQVRIRLLGTETADGRIRYRTQANIDSYRGVPFVDLHAIYDDLIDQSIYSAWFRSKLKEDHGWDTVYYTYDYPGNEIYVANRPSPGGAPAADDTLKINSYYQDGLSLFFLARREVVRKHEVTVPTIVNEKLGTTSFEFLAKREGVEIDALEYPVDVLYFRGMAGFVGIFGLTGEFEGWFSNDDARVPILAKMKVIIGNVRIELMKWKRNGWSPPRYKEPEDR